MAERIVGRLAARAYQLGDPLPATGSQCLVSGANADVESDQHRSYSWRQVIGFTDDDEFVCLQTPGCWPTVERTTNCWFAEIPSPKEPTEAPPMARMHLRTGSTMDRDDIPVDDENDTRSCPDCDASGFDDEDGSPCGRCGGLGYIDAHGPTEAPAQQQGMGSNA